MKAKRIRLYLDTSVWNFFYADDAPEKMEVTRKFFESLGKEDYEIYASSVVLREIENASAETGQLLIALFQRYSPLFLEINEEIDGLADVYIHEGVIPERKRADALHIATATFYEMDALVSWNYKHLANLRKKERVRAANILHGYFKELEMITPMEVVGDE